MKTRKTLLVATLIAAMTLAFAVWVSAYSYTEDFGTGDSATLTSLGWASVTGGDCSVTNDYGTYPGWGGRALNPNTATGLEGSTPYYIFEKSMGAVPGSGLWEFSACVYNISDGFGARSYSGNSTVGLGRYGSEGLRNMLTISPKGYSANSWELDARIFTGQAYPNGYVLFGDGNFVNAPCLAQIYIDFDGKQLWATLTNQNTSATVTSPVISFTNWVSFDAFDITLDKRDGQVGLPADNLSITQVVPEPGSLAALSVGSMGLLGLARRKR